jgi:hypothetical protein
MEQYMISTLSNKRLYNENWKQSVEGISWKSIQKDLRSWKTGIYEDKEINNQQHGEENAYGLRG